MDQKVTQRILIGCGIFVLLAACIGGISLVGGLVWFGSQNDTPEVSTQPQATAAGGTTSGQSVTPVADLQSGALSEEVPFRAVVQIRAYYYEQDDLYLGWTGSGSIISPDGYILTNAHVVLSDAYYHVDELVIALTIAEDKEPIEMYFAEVLQADESLDLAVIKVTRDLNGNPIQENTLNLPYIGLGDADELHLGDEITILGYPGIGGETITLTTGEISGFTSESPYGDRAFIKTSATIAGGNSGGLAVGPQGRIVGVPTQLGYGGDDDFVDCRVLADTNRDGEIDDNDTCIPTGGFINALRPINLALPLIEAARAGQVAVIAESNPVQEVESELPSPDEGGNVLLEDDFSGPGSSIADWSVGDRSGNGYVEYVNNELHVNVKPDNYYIWTTAGVNYSDAVMFADTKIISSTGVGDYGFICRYQDDSNFYGLEITEDRYAAIWKYEGGEYSLLSSDVWVYVEEIPMNSASVELAAACVGDLLVLAVNGEPILEVRDGSFSTGDIGLIAGTWEKGGLTISFDNLHIVEPE